MRSAILTKIEHNSLCYWCVCEYTLIVGWTEDPITGHFVFSELRDVHVISCYIRDPRVSCREFIIGDMFQECLMIYCWGVVVGLKRWWADEPYICFGFLFCVGGIFYFVLLPSNYDSSFVEYLFVIS